VDPYIIHLGAISCFYLIIPFCINGRSGAVAKKKIFPEIRAGYAFSGPKLAFNLLRSWLVLKKFCLPAGEF
jgi:hypothetical protein